MRKYCLSVVLGLGLSLAALAQDRTGSITKEVPNQVGVFECRLDHSDKALKISDIVTIMRQGEPVGEATVVSVSGKASCQVSLKGDFQVRPGDHIEFARSVGQPVAEHHSKHHNSTSPKSVGGLSLETTRTFKDSGRHLHVVAKIKNNTGARVETSTLVCGWENAGGKMVYTDRKTIPALDPGRSTSIEIKSTLKQDPNTVETLSDSVATERDGSLTEKLSIQAGASKGSSGHHDSDLPRNSYYRSYLSSNKKMSVSSVASVLHVPKSQVEGWIKSGQLKSKKGVIMGSDVKKLIDKGIYRPNPGL